MKTHKIMDKFNGFQSTHFGANTIPLLSLSALSHNNTTEHTKDDDDEEEKEKKKKKKKKR